MTPRGPGPADPLATPAPIDPGARPGPSDPGATPGPIEPGATSDPADPDPGAGPSADLKQAIRERVWRALERAGVVRFPGARGRIPNFVGAERAADRLAAEEAWRTAVVLKCNPDAPQGPVRLRALREGKLVYMAVPRLARPKPFLALDPARLSQDPRGLRRAASIRGATAAGIPVGLEGMRHIDLIVCGSVAVDRRGGRLGKGGGYSDLEFALAREAGLVDHDTVIATTVHPLQVLDEPLPETAHDFRVDLIVTPDEAIRAPRAPRPPGVLWDHLEPERLVAIPVLAGLARARDRLPPLPPGR
jgi:5-formyltetrahydrofolate cyclo-ligase